MRYTRRRCGRGFTYRDPSGRCLPKGPTREWINSLAIPPAWQDVVIDSDRQAKVYATGRDQAGRKQYLYNPAWRAVRDEEKFARIIRFASGLTRMRRVTGQHLAKQGLPRDKVLACMVRLIDCAYFRPGSERYTEENESYGLTTLRSRHLILEDEEITFRYPGKSGVTQEKHIDNDRLCRIIRDLDETPGHRVFKYFGEDGRKVYVSADDLNDYIREVMGEDFSAKDFRTWAGTSLAALALDELGVAEQTDQAESNIRAAIESVAQRLGNTPEVARASYIDPRVIDSYLDGLTLAYFRKIIEKELQDDWVSPTERAILKLLRHRVKDQAHTSTL